MKRLFIFALMTMAASSSFAMSDKLNCINGRVNVSTYRHINDDSLRLTAGFMVDDIGTFHSVVETKSSFTQKVFTGKTADGRDMKFVVKRHGLKGTLTIAGLPGEEGFICKEQILFEM
jgi:hypothetical protein